MSFAVNEFTHLERVQSAWQKSDKVLKPRFISYFWESLAVSNCAECPTQLIRIAVVMEAIRVGRVGREVVLRIACCPHELLSVR